MTLSAPLRWLLLLTVAVSVYMFFQDETPAPSEQAARGTSALSAAATNLPRTAQAGVRSTKATDANPLGDTSWPLRLPDPSDSEWPRQQLASNYGWEPTAPPPPKPVLLKPLAVVAPPPPPPVPQGPPPAPPFPYQMVGLLEQDGVTLAWLTRATAVGAGGGDTRTVVAEQVLDGRWRVGMISPRGMSVTWLETGQTLQIKYAQ
jgi:hypothetical protein